MSSAVLFPEPERPVMMNILFFFTVNHVFMPGWHDGLGHSMNYNEWDVLPETMMG